MLADQVEQGINIFGLLQATTVQADVNLDTDAQALLQRLGQRQILFKPRQAVDQPLHLGSRIKTIAAIELAIELCGSSNRHRFAQ